MKIIIGKKFNRDFKRLAKKYGSLGQDIAELFKLLEANPKMGIPICHDCFKILNTRILQIKNFWLYSKNSNNVCCYTLYSASLAKRR
jgi:hypothetical protein